MEILLYIAIIILWIGQAVLIYGMEFAYWQREYPVLAEDNYDVDKEDALISAVFALLCPVVLLLGAWIMFDYGRHGIKFK